MNKSRAAVELTKDRNGTGQVLLRNPRGASARAVFKPPNVVQAGIAICFPQAYIDLLLKPSEDDLKIWPHRERFTEQGDALTFESEVDRVYLSSRDVIAIFDHERKRTFFIRKEGFPDVGVWNPWEKKSKAMVDFGDEEYKQI